MPYKIIFSEGAGTQLKRLDRTSAARIIKKLESIAENPNRFMARLENREELKLRIGDYRLIAMVLPKENTIFIIAAGHRRDIYTGIDLFKSC